jgi:hypothetical protein
MWVNLLLIESAGPDSPQTMHSNKEDISQLDQRLDSFIAMDTSGCGEILRDRLTALVSSVVFFVPSSRFFSSFVTQEAYRCLCGVQIAGREASIREVIHEQRPQGQDPGRQECYRIPHPRVYRANQSPPCIVLSDLFFCSSTVIFLSRN